MYKIRLNVSLTIKLIDLWLVNASHWLSAFGVWQE